MAQMRRPATHRPATPHEVGETTMGPNGEGRRTPPAGYPTGPQRRRRLARDGPDRRRLGDHGTPGHRGGCGHRRRPARPRDLRGVPVPARTGLPPASSTGGSGLHPGSFLLIADDHGRAVGFIAGSTDVGRSVPVVPVARRDRRLRGAPWVPWSGGGGGPSRRFATGLGAGTVRLEGPSSCPSPSIRAGGAEVSAGSCWHRSSMRWPPGDARPPTWSWVRPTWGRSPSTSGPGS